MPIAKFRAANGRCAAAAEDCGATAEAHAAACAGLEIDIVQFKAVVEWVEGASAPHAGALRAAAVDFYDVAAEAHETVVSSKAATEAAVAHGDKREAFRAETVVFDS